jgi:hypothetical protein
MHARRARRTAQCGVHREPDNGGSTMVRSDHRRNTSSPECANGSSTQIDTLVVGSARFATRGSFSQPQRRAEPRASPSNSTRTSSPDCAWLTKLSVTVTDNGSHTIFFV